ncbi:hypothetical protein MN608_07185 [Microdochium nivale]|nr:hypothetical protein MN608_07185 [Microdochium nivale]
MQRARLRLGVTTTVGRHHCNNAFNSGLQTSKSSKAAPTARYCTKAVPPAHRPIAAAYHSTPGHTARPLPFSYSQPCGLPVNLYDYHSTYRKSRASQNRDKNLAANERGLLPTHIRAREEYMIGIAF